ncbi:MAG: anthranilate/aminodeoxychorismate synthase component II [Chlamydiales bacterium]|nr:aminodeoxychorismate/anthranilate synthase component II [Chlamydiales bacterium]NCF71679.1 anthranilate/aminodeoxychorismate synthase component II [Chlamydiales bacterium]
MLLLIDNFDSFTFLLANYFSSCGVPVEVVPNDSIDPEGQLIQKADYLVVSPGPGNVQDAGLSVDCIKSCMGRIPILGVCLGHQCIANIFGASIVPAKNVMHGKTSSLTCYDSSLFSGVPKNIQVTRYHSLVVDPQTLPKSFRVIAYSDDNEIMAIEHKDAAIWGVQFHPESIKTQYGRTMIRNFLASNGQFAKA